MSLIYIATLPIFTVYIGQLVIIYPASCFKTWVCIIFFYKNMFLSYSQRSLNFNYLRHSREIKFCLKLIHITTELLLLLEYNYFNFIELYKNLSCKFLNTMAHSTLAVPWPIHYILIHISNIPCIAGPSGLPSGSDPLSILDI